MNASERIDQLEKHIKDAQEELNLLKADIAKGEEVDLSLPMGGDGWCIKLTGVNYGDWSDLCWVFKTEAEAEWTRRHELAWRKLRFYADKLNKDEKNCKYYLRPHHRRSGEIIIDCDLSVSTCVEVVFFHSVASAERALKELGDDVNYLWSWNRKSEEKAR